MVSGLVKLLCRLVGVFLVIRLFSSEFVVFCRNCFNLGVLGVIVFIIVLCSFVLVMFFMLLIILGGIVSVFRWGVLVVVVFFMEKC